MGCCGVPFMYSMTLFCEIGCEGARRAAAAGPGSAARVSKREEPSDALAARPAGALARRSRRPARTEGSNSPAAALRRGLKSSCESWSPLAGPAYPRSMIATGARPCEPTRWSEALPKARASIWGEVN